MSISTQAPTGFRDFFGDEAMLRHETIEKIRRVYESFGFTHLETPALERLEILQGSGGGENEKLIFKVLKRGDKLREELAKIAESNDAARDSEAAIAEYGLRFDLTVPLSRIVSEYRGEILFPFKACHIGPVWRAERAQKGRFREFIQADADIVGSKSWGADVEVIQAGVSAVYATGASGFILKINHRAWLRAALLKEGVSEARHLDFLIALDKKDKLDVGHVRKELEGISGKSLSLAMEKILAGDLTLREAETLDEASGHELSQVIQTLSQLGLPLEDIVFDPSLARGLGYYTGCIFELRHATEGFSFGGGGRYDQLIGRFSKESLPAVGFSIGFDRLMLLLSAQKKDGILKNNSLFMPLFNQELLPAVLKIAKRLREQSIQVDVFPEAAKLKNQFKFADARHYRWALIVGEDELKSGLLKLKDMRSGAEETLDELAVAGRIKSL